jgi:hypothetical protein
MEHEQGTTRRSKTERESKETQSYDCTPRQISEAMMQPYPDALQLPSPGDSASWQLHSKTLSLLNRLDPTVK